MRRLIVAGLIAAAIMPAIAQAQSRELDRDRRDIRQEQRDVRQAERRGAPYAAIRDERRDVRAARREYREDWRDHRRSNPDLYRGSAYAGPRGWTYRPVSAGYRFQPAFYDRRYWIADPWRYRLPRTGGYERWVRYGNDVVLVNTRNGRVIAVHNRFFF